MAILRVTPWEYSAIRKNAADLTEGEFIRWMLEKWPFLRDNLYERVDVEVDWGNGNEPTGEAMTPRAYILSIGLSR